MKKSSSAQGVTPGDVSTLLISLNLPSVQQQIHPCIHYTATHGPSWYPVSLLQSLQLHSAVGSVSVNFVTFVLPSCPDKRITNTHGSKVQNCMSVWSVTHEQMTVLYTTDRFLAGRTAESKMVCVCLGMCVF